MSLIYGYAFSFASNQNSFTRQVLLDSAIQTQYNYVKIL